MKEIRKNIHIKAFSLKELFWDSKRLVRRILNHRCFFFVVFFLGGGRLLTRNVPSPDCENKNAEFRFSFMPDVRIKASVPIKCSYFIENTPLSTHKHTDASKYIFTLIRTLNSSVTLFRQYNLTCQELSPD